MDIQTIFTKLSVVLISLDFHFRFKTLFSVGASKYQKVIKTNKI